MTIPNQILVDTSAYSLSRKGHAGIIQMLQEIDEINFSPITLGELAAGYLHGNRIKLHKELTDFLSSPRVKIVVINEGTAERYAAITSSLWKAGTPLPENDVWIAASAMQYGLTVLTTDKHFQRIPQIMVRHYEP